MTSYHASPVNVSPGAFTVGFFGTISNGLLLAGLRRWPDVGVEERTAPPCRPVRRDALNLLANWAATLDQAEAAQVADEP